MEKSFSFKELRRQPRGSGGADAMARPPVPAVGAAADAEIRFRLLRRLARHPESSQRAIAASLGIALGRVNLLLRGLVAEGLVRRHPVRAPGNRPGQGHWPTHAGLAEMARLARAVLVRKQAEHAALAQEIAGIEAEFVGARPPRGWTAGAERGA
jgi:DNA-binding MarR family transcriptional regulator